MSAHLLEIEGLELEVISTGQKLVAQHVRPGQGWRDHGRGRGVRQWKNVDHACSHWPVASHDSTLQWIDPIGRG